MCRKSKSFPEITKRTLLSDFKFHTEERKKAFFPKGIEYLSGSALLFPTYTYDDEGGFVAQHVRGNYTRDDEQTIADVKAGELYLFSGGQLRFYFKDIEGQTSPQHPLAVTQIRKV